MQFEQVEFVVLHLFCWLFLSTVQSEVLPFEMGCGEELVGDLPVGRHSAVLVVCAQSGGGQTCKALHVR